MPLQAPEQAGPVAGAGPNEGLAALLGGIDMVVNTVRDNGGAALLDPVADGATTLADAIRGGAGDLPTFPALGETVAGFLPAEGNGTGTDTGTGSGTGTGSETGNEGVAGPLSSSAAALTGALPVEMITTAGPAIEDGINGGAATLDGLLGTGGGQTDGGESEGGDSTDSGPLSSGAAALTGALPVEMIPAAGPAIEDGINTGAATLDGLLGTGGGSESDNSTDVGPLSSGAAALTGALPVEMIPAAGPAIEDGINGGAATLDGLLGSGGMTTTSSTADTDMLSLTPISSAIQSQAFQAEAWGPLAA